jgi:hypothetical protein
VFTLKANKLSARVILSGFEKSALSKLILMPFGPGPSRDSYAWWDPNFKPKHIYVRRIAKDDDRRQNAFSALISDLYIRSLISDLIVSSDTVQVISGHSYYINKDFSE